MTNIEKGIISIRYNSRELRWIKSSTEGDYFFRPYNGVVDFKPFSPHDEFTEDKI